MQKKDTLEPSAQPLFCPNCRFPVDAGDTFCGECGFDLTQAAGAISKELSFDEGRESSGDDALVARVKRLKAPRGLRRSYFDLGLALRAGGAYAAASEAFEKALQTSGNAPAAFDILCQQAYASEQAGNLERAFRTYLEGVRRAPAEAADVLPHLQRLLNPRVALENGAWLVSEWGGVEKTHLDPTGQVQVAAFIGRVLLFQGQYEAALGAFQRAIRADPTTAQGVIVPLLEPETLPPEFDPKANHGQAQFTLARIWYLLGRSDDALRAVEIALGQNLGEGDYPEAPVQRLKADLLRQTGDKAGAAQWYYEAGRRYTWRGEYETAAELLDLSVSLKPDSAPTCWAWMEAERARAYTNAAPYADADIVERSLRAWRAGLRIGPPTPEFFWIYTSRALLAELEARLNLDRRVDHWWDALRWLALALVFEPQDAYSWAYLGRFSRYLSLEAIDDRVTQVAMQLDEKNEAVLEERAALLANRGLFEQAAQVIADRQALGANIWVDAVSAVVFAGQARAADAELLYQGQTPALTPEKTRSYEQALKLLNGAVEAEPNDSWYRELRAMCLRALPPHQEEARQETRKVYELCLDPAQADNPDVRYSRAWAAFLLGKVEEAIALYEELSQDVLLGSSALRNLGICRLAQGDLQAGEQAIQAGLEGAHNSRECDDLIFDLHETVRLSPALDARIRAQVAARRAALAQPQSAIREIESASQHQPSLAWGKKAARTAALALQARLALLDQDFAAAMESSRQLAQDAFPAREQALAGVMDAWQNAIDAQFKAGQVEDARQGLLQQRAQAEFEGQAARLAGLLSRLALAHYCVGDEANGHTTYQAALQAGERAQWVAPGESIGETWRELLTSPTQMWQADGALQTLVGDADTMEEVAATCRSLLPYLERYFQLDHTLQAGEDPFTLPITLWVGADLVSLVDPAVNDAFIHQDIPTLRQRILDERGVMIPAVRVKDHNQDGRLFQIDLFEMPVAQGYANPDRSFCHGDLEALKSAGIPEADLQPGTAPDGQTEGCWVAPDRYSAAISAGHFRMSSPAEYLLLSLENTLRRRLADFVDVPGTQYLLDRLDGRWHDLVDRQLPNLAAHHGFARLLRALVWENVPVVRLPAILQALPDGSLADPARFGETLRLARLALKDDLPGNQGQTRYPVPPEWETRLAGWLVEVEGRLELAPPPGDGDRLLEEAADWLQNKHFPGVLVVLDGQVRVLLQRVLEGRFPDWPVLAQEEVVETRAQA